MRTKRTATLLGLSIWLSACGGHEAPPPRDDRPPWHPPTTMLLPYVGPDGTLTRAEMEAGLRRDFEKADPDHDGCLDADQVRAINQQRWKEDASTASPLIDFKHNGCVDFDEFAATPRSLFDQLDADGNGRLTADELHPGKAKAEKKSPGAEKRREPPEGGEGPQGDDDDH